MEDGILIEKVIALSVNSESGKSLARNVYLKSEVV